MRRRDFIAVLGGAAAWPLAARAQQATMPVIGFLNALSPQVWAPYVTAFRQGLKEAGYVEGENVAIEYRWAQNRVDRLSALAAELVRLRVAVIVASGGDAPVLAAKEATATIPIVTTMGGDPVESHLVASLNRPGGNVTGVSVFSTALVAKRLELLRELVPGATTLGMFVDPNNPNAEGDTKDAQAAADMTGRRLLALKIRAESELAGAFETLAGQHISALFVSANANFMIWRDQLIALAARHKVAASYTTRDFVVAGGLMSYGSDLTEVYRQVGLYAGQVLKGAKPAELPVMQPTKYELVLNLKTAKALGLEIPPTVLATADEVIE